MNDRPAWFAPKKRGLGSGPPMSWQGWAVLVGYVAGIFILAPLAERSLPGFLSATTALTAVFMLICAKTTPGGWHWRNEE